MSSWKNTVAKYTDGDNIKEDPMNRPIIDLESRTDYLKTALDQLLDYSSISSAGLGLAEDTAAGNAVYFNKTTSVLTKAQAQWQLTYTVNGEALPAESSYVYGIVLDKTSAGTGTVLLSGEAVLDATALNNLFGSATPATGIYYLSTTTAGTVTAALPGMPVLTVQYLGSGRIRALYDAFPKHGHSHKEYALTAGWLDVSDSQFDNYTPPAGADKGYDRASDPDIAELFSFFTGDAVIIDEDNKVAASSDFVVTEENVWHLQAEDPGDVRLFATIPLSYGQSIVRAVSTDNTDELTITSTNGVVSINPAAWAQYGETANSAYAVSSVSGRKYTLTPVISGISAGTGADVSVGSDGVAVISLETSANAKKYPDQVNLNNATHVTDGDIMYYSLPENRAASIIGVIPVGKLSSASSYKAYVFVEPAGMQLNASYPALSFKLTLHSEGSASGVALSGATSLSGTFSTFSSKQGYKYNFQETTGLAVTSNGILYLKISIGSSSGNKNLYGFGVVITAV